MSAAKKVSRFARDVIGHGPTVYVCHVCKRKTRETGEGESGVGLCAYCFLEAGLENSLSDGAMPKAEFDSELAKLKARYARGGA